MEKHIATLSDSEVAQLQALTSKGRHAAAKVVNARWCCSTAIKRMAADARRRKLPRSCKSVHANRQQVQREYQSKIDGELEAQLIAMSCSAAPSGHARWSLRLLELELVQAVSHETVRQVLKKRTQALAQGGVGDRTRGQWGETGHCSSNRSPSATAKLSASRW
jgi:hypothetical protein